MFFCSSLLSTTNCSLSETASVTSDVHRYQLIASTASWFRPAAASTRTKKVLVQFVWFIVYSDCLFRSGCYINGNITVSWYFLCEFMTVVLFCKFEIENRKRSKRRLWFIWKNMFIQLFLEKNSWYLRLKKCVFRVKYSSYGIINNTTNAQWFDSASI